MSIEQLSKNKFRFFKSLHLKKNRDKENLFIIEGKKFVSDISRRYPERIQAIITYDESEIQELPPEIDIYLSDRETYMTLSSLQQPTSLMAVVIKSEQSIDKVEWNDLLVIADRIQNPGNLGTIIRTCDWFGIGQLILLRGTVDAYNAKVVQASAGSLVNMELIKASAEQIIERLEGHKLWLLDSQGIPMTTAEFTHGDKHAVVVGNEGAGLDDHLFEKMPHTTLSIPSIPRPDGSTALSDSLNASISTSIVLHHICHTIRSSSTT